MHPNHSRLESKIDKSPSATPINSAYHYYTKKSRKDKRSRQINGIDIKIKANEKPIAPYTSYLNTDNNVNLEKNLSISLDNSSNNDRSERELSPMPMSQMENHLESISKSHFKTAHEVRNGDLSVEKHMPDKKGGFNSIIRSSIDLGSKSDISSETSYSDDFDEFKVKRLVKITRPVKQAILDAIVYKESKIPIKKKKEISTIPKFKGVSVMDEKDLTKIEVGQLKALNPEIEQKEKAQDTSEINSLSRRKVFVNMRDKILRKQIVRNDRMLAKNWNPTPLK